MQLLCNRAFCYEKLQLNRKALKVRCLSITTLFFLTCYCHLTLQHACISRPRCCNAQDYEAALQTEPNNLQILLRQGRVLHALRRTQVRPRSICK